MVAPLAQAIQDAQADLRVQEQQRDHALYNSLAAQRPRLWAQLDTALSEVGTLGMQLLVSTRRMRELAWQLGVRFPAEEKNPERILAGAILARLADVAPLPERRTKLQQPVLQAEDEPLGAKDNTVTPLPTDLAAAHAAGNAQVWLQFSGKQALSLASYGIQRPLDVQDKLRHGRPTVFTRDEVEKLRGYPHFDEVFEVVSEPIWGQW